MVRPFWGVSHKTESFDDLWRSSNYTLCQWDIHSAGVCFFKSIVKCTMQKHCKADMLAGKNFPGGWQRWGPGMELAATAHTISIPPSWAWSKCLDQQKCAPVTSTKDMTQCSCWGLPRDDLQQPKFPIGIVHTGATASAHEHLVWVGHLWFT